MYGFVLLSMKHYDGVSHIKQAFIEFWKKVVKKKRKAMKSCSDHQLNSFSFYSAGNDFVHL